MVLRVAMLTFASSSTRSSGSFLRWAHAIAQPPPLGTAINHSVDTTTPLDLPESQYSNGIENVFPSWSFLGGSMELMAVPKRKVSPHKRGIRNGPKALKPVPVIIRCKACGRVKLPHFFCCSGIKPNPGEHTS